MVKSSNTDMLRHESVKNWWMVCLNKEWVVNRLDKWTNDLTLHKTDMYNAYNKSCVGESLGIMMFWCHMNKLVKYVSETSTHVELPRMIICRQHFPNDKWRTREHVFDHNHLSDNKSTNSVHDWWNVCLLNGKIHDMDTTSWETDKISLSKREIYDIYKKHCSGRVFGTLMFWKHLTSVLSVKHQEHHMFGIPSLLECRLRDNKWETEHHRLFQPTHVLTN